MITRYENEQRFFNLFIDSLKQFETILFPQDMIQDIYVTLEHNT